MALDIVPKNKFVAALIVAADERDLSLKAIAEHIEGTYEHTRKIFNALAFPSKYVLKMLCQVLKLDFKEMEQLVVAEKIRHKFGTIPEELAGKNPELSEMERLWPLLSSEQKDCITAMVEGVVRHNRRAAKS